MIRVVDNVGRTAQYPSAHHMETDPSGALVIRNADGRTLAIWGHGSYQCAEYGTRGSGVVNQER